MKLGILAVVLILAGCVAVDPKPFKGPTGRQGYTMNCSGMGRTLDQCYQKAGEICPNGYSVVDRPANQVFAGGILSTTFQLVIECR